MAEIPTLTCRVSLEQSESNPAHNDYGSITVAGRRSPKDYTPTSGVGPGAGVGVGGRIDLQGPSTGTPSTSMELIMDQRQPLLPEKDGLLMKGAYEYLDEHVAVEMPSFKQSATAASAVGVVEIDMLPGGIVRTEPRFPKEKWKTFIAFVILVVNFIATTVSLALVHERVPDRHVYGPLPDIVLDGIGSMDWALDVSEVLIMISTNSCAILLFFHKHRFIVMRRVFLIMSVLYLMRSVTMYVTVLPVPSTTYYCSPKSNDSSPFLVTKRVIQLISGFGLSINGKHTFCGDYIYSGHTVMLVLGCLVITEYSPKKCFPVHWISWLVSTTGVLMVLLAHGHYTVDVIIAYYVTTRIFWTYHTMANNPTLKQHGPNNYLARVFWYPAFQFFEKNIGGPVPRKYDWPLPWPRRFLSKHPNRDS